LAVLVLLELSVAADAWGQVNVLNVNYDNQQTGANVQETILSPKSNWNQFGKLGTFPVDGQVYAQPLYVSGVTISGVSSNVLYIATMHNSVFAFNADTPQTTTPLWRVNLGPSVPSGFFNFTDIIPETGILGTPVIDPVQQVMYLVSDTLTSIGPLGNPILELHALSIVDGHEMLGGPRPIIASVAGNGDGSANGLVAFDATEQLQRPGLMLSNGMLYIGFGSHGDDGVYHGWMLGYDASTLQLKATFNTSPNGNGSAIWQSGRAPVIGSNGDVYAVTGNGDFDGVSNFGESVLHLDGTHLSLLDWYTPDDYATLTAQDWDLGSAGAVAIANTNLLLAASKAGMLYLVQENSMGHLGPTTTSTVQGVQVNTWGFFNMALWNGPSQGPIFYDWDPYYSLKAFQIVNGQINSTILSQFTPQYPSPSAGLAVSANGAQDGILWLTTGNYNVNGVPATLYALDAGSIANELWDSNLNGTRDQPGGFSKFTGPTVVNGRVYLPTFSDSVVVYGILTAEPLAAAPSISAIVNSASYLSGGVAPGELVTIFGANLGPPVAASGTLESGAVTDVAQHTQILIGGILAPILFASPSQINIVVPFGLSGTSAQVQVFYHGQLTASATVPVQAASPALFASDGSGGGPGAILNQDGSVNSPINPAAPGSVVSMFATGAGVTNPTSVDGALTAAPYPAPRLPVSVTIGGVPAKITYAGAAPGLVAGVIQINAVVPATAPPVSWDQVILTVGDTVSPTAITMTVQ
jgi:uncharacterized protein (TIGR03437 family)